MTPTGRVRLDRWLWAARLFKTRSLAKQAVDGGRVHVGGQRAKAGRRIAPGDTLQLRRGLDDMTLVVRALSERRGSAIDALALFEETAASRVLREQRAAERRAVAGPTTAARPDKRQRRLIHRFKRDQPEI